MAVCLATGLNHTIARRRDGTVWTWGDGSNGQLGLDDPTMTVRRVPTQVPGISSAREVEGGWSTSFVRTAEGLVRACGWHLAGQLGRPATEPQISFRPVLRFRRPRTVSAGSFHCLATYKSQVYAWGMNLRGGFGIGSGSVGDIWVYPRPLPGVDGVTRAVAGLFGQSFLLRRSGPRLLAAGLNNHGQLGDGTTQDRTEFVAIPGMSDVVAIETGNAYTLALLDDGTVWAWGLNDVGQLGDGTRVSSLTPVRVGQLRRIVAISAGYSHALALDDAGRVSERGHVVDNVFFDVRSAPVKVEIPRPVVAIAAGYTFSHAVDDNGDVWGWGVNGEGQVGTGSTALRVPEPTRLDGISQVG